MAAVPRKRKKPERPKTTSGRLPDTSASQVRAANGCTTAKGEKRTIEQTESA